MLVNSCSVQGGWSALMWASYKGHTDIALMLLERGADHNAHGNYHISSLLWAAGRGHTAIAKALIEHGAKVNVGDKVFANHLQMFYSKIYFLKNHVL